MLTERYKSIMQKVKQMSVKRGPLVTLGEGTSVRGESDQAFGHRLGLSSTESRDMDACHPTRQQKKDRASGIQSSAAITAPWDTACHPSVELV